MLLFLSCIFSVLILSSAADTIPTNQPLTDGKTIISSGGKFEFGFFSPQTSDTKRYLGIWFYKVPTQTVVWVANRDNPLNDKNGTLNFNRQGVLTVVSGSGHAVWSSNVSRSAQNPTAQLLDSGNLVVRDAIENYLWQSFDYPGDMLLPGMKVGIDLKTGFRRSLWSWKSTNDPSNGKYCFTFDPRGFPQQFIMNGSSELYRSGPWNGRGFVYAPSQQPSASFNYTYVSDPEKTYYTYELTDASIFARTVMHLNGFLHLMTWNNQTQNWDGFGNLPADNCDHYGQCQAYGLCNSGNSPICKCLDKFEPKKATEWERGNWSAGC